MEKIGRIFCTKGNSKDADEAIDDVLVGGVTVADDDGAGQLILIASC